MHTLPITQLIRDPKTLDKLFDQGDEAIAILSRSKVKFYAVKPQAYQDKTQLDQPKLTLLKPKTKLPKK